MRHNRRDDGQLSCRKREMKTMNANTALDGHTTVIKMAQRGGVPLIVIFRAFEIRRVTSFLTSFFIIGPPPPLEAMLVIFGRRALIFFLFESS